MNDNVIRQSQLITTWGPGAMIDLPEYSVIVSGLQDWATLRREKVNEPRLVAKLRRILDTQSLELFTPPRHEENAQRAAPVGARIFPTWFIVKGARLSPRNAQWRRRRLVRWDQLHKRRFVEDGKRKPVVPVRFVSACPKGHIDDLNWRGFVHPGGRRCEKPLWLEERGTSGDIVDTYAVCECGAERSLYEAAGARTSALGRCGGKRPWIGQFAREACEESCRLLVRTASNACFPQTMSVISLPESDAGLAARVSQHRDRLKAADDLGALASFRMIPELAAAFADVDDAAVIAEYRRQREGGGGADVPVKDAEFEILDKGDARIGEDDPPLGVLRRDPGPRRVGPRRVGTGTATRRSLGTRPFPARPRRWWRRQAPASAVAGRTGDRRSKPSTSWCWCIGCARWWPCWGSRASRRSARTRTARSTWTWSGRRSPRP